MVESYLGGQNWRGRLLRYAPIVFWTGVIFFLSSSNGSMTETSLFIRPLLHFLLPTATEATIQIVHGYIRKAAHVTEYAILALLIIRALARSSYAFLRGLRYALPLVLVAAVAVTDELNQSFEASRTGSVRDVLLDIAGGLAAVVFVVLICRIRAKKAAPSA